MADSVKIADPDPLLNKNRRFEGPSDILIDIFSQLQTTKKPPRQLDGYVGFANLPNQVCRILMNKLFFQIQLKRRMNKVHFSALVGYQLFSYKNLGRGSESFDGSKTFSSDPDLDPTCNNGYMKLFSSLTKYKPESKKFKL